tara:strand:- start:5980 stop:6216 length:237 start_codon:yes stop_codon:yes gene_type:complete
MINFQGVKKYTVEEWKNVTWDIDGVAENPDDQSAVNAFIHCKSNILYLQQFFKYMGWEWVDLKAGFSKVKNHPKGPVQ